MIGLYPHLGYLLAWPFHYHPWDESGTPGFFELLIVSFSVFLALALLSHQRWAGFLAAVIALLVAAAQFHRIHFLLYRSGWLNSKVLWTMLNNALATGAFLKLIASLISALLAITLLRVLLGETIRRQSGAVPAPSIAFERGQLTRRLLPGLLLLSALTLLILALVTPASLGEYFGNRSGFSVLFLLLALIPVGVAAAGLWITGDRFFVGIAAAYSSLFPILLVGTWYLELANPISPVRQIKAPVWTALVVCLGILAVSVRMAYRGWISGSAHQGKFSLGVIVSLAFLAASLDVCNMQGLLRN